jgi:hypothetical protein
VLQERWGQDGMEACAAHWIRYSLNADRARFQTESIVPKTSIDSVGKVHKASQLKFHKSVMIVRDTRDNQGVCNNRYIELGRYPFALCLVQIIEVLRT